MTCRPEHARGSDAASTNGLAPKESQSPEARDSRMASPAVGRSRTSCPGESPRATYACRRSAGASAAAGSIPAASMKSRFAGVSADRGGNDFQALIVADPLEGLGELVDVPVGVFGGPPCWCYLPHHKRSIPRLVGA